MSRTPFYDATPATSHENLLANSPINKEEHMSSTHLSHKDAPWLTLNVKSPHTARSSSQTMPLFKQPGSQIVGNVVLLLEKPEALHAVKVVLRGVSSFATGELSTPAVSSPTLGNTHTFMEIAETLWSSSEGIPKHADPPPWGFPKNGKLQGKFTFFFTFRLPEHLTEVPRPKDAPESYPPPASWFSKKSPVSIDYDVTVTLVRGTLKTNTTLSMNFYYAPRSKPDPPPESRRLAYADGFPLLDPLADAAGWHTVYPPRKVTGKLSNGRTVDIVCTFALAKPLSYGRGSFIPVNLGIQCSDSHALDLVQSPLAISIILLQCITTGKHARSEKQRLGRDVHVSPVARAVCWHLPSAGEWADCRTLMGEIVLSKKMPPTTISPRVVIRYSVVMLPFDITGFTALEPHTFVVECPVDITTHNADGPPPRSQVPPGYVDPRRGITDQLDQMMNAISMFG